MRHKANQLLLVGIILIVAGAIFGLFVPNIVLFIDGQHSSTLAVGSLEILTRTIVAVITPLGVALTAGGIVVRTIVGKDDQLKNLETETAEESRPLR